MIKAGPKSASISAMLIFADLRHVTNGIAKAHHRSILANDVEQVPRFLLSSHESTSHARPIVRSALRALTWKSLEGQRISVACSPKSLASRRCSFRRSPISHSSTLPARGSVFALVARRSSARPGPTNTNDATKAPRKDSKWLLAAPHGGQFSGGILRRING
jgi:hypothetical protein